MTRNYLRGGDTVERTASNARNRHPDLAEGRSRPDTERVTPGVRWQLYVVAAAS